jgi:hypothetical protein
MIEEILAQIATILNIETRMQQLMFATISERPARWGTSDPIIIDGRTFFVCPVCASLVLHSDNSLEAHGRIHIGDIENISTLSVNERVILHEYALAINVD